MLKNYFKRIVFVVCFALASQAIMFQTATIAVAQEISLQEKIKALPGVLGVEALKCKPPFTEKYLIKLKQWNDHSDTTAGWFSQQVFLSHNSFAAPMVLVTEGYAASYAEYPNYTEELASLFNTNQICVEHRYFGKSVPDDKEWKYLTTANAAADHHRVTQLLKSIYKGKWINTGISKGGETALIHRTLYPDDVDISVCYVGPLCFSVEDGRHEPFIENIPGTQADRDKIKAFQTEVLKRRKKIFPMFKSYCEEKQYTFNLPLQEIYDYCVFEFSFSFWQWGWKPSSVPSEKASDKDLFEYLVRVCSPDYFANEGIESTRAFFIQAAKELGYYGYDTKPFEKYLKVKSAEGYLEKIFLPQGILFEFDSTISQKCVRFITDNDPKMIFIYGEYDPWSAAAVEFKDKKNMYKAVCPAESHAARIGSLPKTMKEEVTARVQRWLDE